MRKPQRMDKITQAFALKDGMSLWGTLKRKAHLLFLVPSLIGLAVFFLVPLIDVVRRSFMRSMGDVWVGFANYQTVLGNDAFQLAVGNTALFMRKR